MNNIFSQIEFIHIDTIIGTDALQRLLAPVQKPFTALCLRPIDADKSAVTIGQAIEELANPSTGLCFFGPYFLPGSIRDDFDFGPVLIGRTIQLQEVSAKLNTYEYSAFYSLWLTLSLNYAICAISPEKLPGVVEADSPESGRKSHFDYVDPKNRKVQIELERAFTDYLRVKGALLQNQPAEIEFTANDFPVEVSVIIPVRNRVRTIADALESALCQLVEKPFNVIVVDNHSTDGTTEVIRKKAAEDNRLVHIIPPKPDELGIGGCWNLAATDPRCGKFCIQLDSDDVYNSSHTVQTILNAFYRFKCGMVVGSYTLTNFNLQTIPPGLIDHREWSDENGRNNLLRINGIGAPRAFYTPLLRKHPAPNVSYGEDYALALVFSRLYRIGRIYESLYNCRRWEDNTDANPPRELVISRNRFKDELRTREIEERIKINKGDGQR